MSTQYIGENEFQVDKVDGFHASKTPTANTIPVYDDYDRFNYKSLNPIPFSAELDTPGWYRIYDGSVVDNILLCISSIFNNKISNCHNLSINISSFNYLPNITQLSGLNISNVYDKIRILTKHNNLTYIDIHYNTNVSNPILVNGIGQGIFKNPVLSNDIPEGYASTEFSTSNGFKANTCISCLSNATNYANGTGYASIRVGGETGAQLLFDNSDVANFTGIPSTEYYGNNTFADINANDYNNGNRKTVGNIIFGKNSLYYRAGTNNASQIVTTATSSDYRLKENIQPLEDRGFINPVTFTKDEKEHLGFIAQDVMTKYPELVRLENDGYYTLNYIEITPILEAQIIKLSKQVEELTNKVNELENKEK